MNTTSTQIPWLARMLIDNGESSWLRNREDIQMLIELHDKILVGHG